MRPFAFAFLFTLVASACRNDDALRVLPARPELVEVDLAESRHILSFLLPDDSWKRIVTDGAPKGFLFGSGDRRLHVTIHLKVHRYEDAEDEARATDAEIRAFTPGSGWPFIGVVVSYRGPPDDAMLEAFERSFKVERR